MIIPLLLIMKYGTKIKGNKIINLLKDLYKIDEDLLNKGAEKFMLPHRLQYDDLVFEYFVRLYNGSDNLSIYDKKTQRTLYEFNNIDNKKFYTKILSNPLFQSIIKGDSEQAFTLINQFLGCEDLNNIFYLQEDSRELFLNGELSIYPNHGIIYKLFKVRSGKEYKLSIMANNACIMLSNSKLSKNERGNFAQNYEVYSLKNQKEIERVVVRINELFEQ